MSVLPRLVVTSGPDAGAEFPIGPAGGGIGRGEENLVQLSDLSVSRAHCALRVEGKRVIVVDAGGRNRTLVNGQPVTEAPLAEGDVITVGKTQLSYLRPDESVAVLPTRAAKITIEVSTDELLRARLGATQAGDQERARRHLAALARLGDGMRKVADRGALTRLACEITREALDADRVTLLLPEGGKLQAVASAGAQATGGLPREIAERCVKKGSAVVLATEAEPGRPALASLAAPFGGEEGRGILHAEREGGAWAEIDLHLVSCVAHLASAGLENLVARDALTRENRALEERLGGGREFVGAGAQSRALLGFVGKVAPSDSTVLLLGESGSGKEMVASAIHYASRRARGPFICLSCATLSETLLDSELFGHEKGAFTGATEKKLGRFERADGGTLFFDEVGELSVRCQTKLLRVLEERAFERVGGTKTITVDVRVMAATNRDLSAMVGRGEFREDLYYRLSVIQAEVPPLRARADDIMALAEYFLGKLRFQMGRRVAGFSAEATRALLAHAWPGNVRELRNAVERAVVLGDGELIRLDDLPPQVLAAAPKAVVPPTMPTAFQPQPVMPAPVPVAPAPASSLRELERQGILAALAATSGNKAQAAAILEIDRSTLYKKLKEYGIDP